MDIRAQRQGQQIENDYDKELYNGDIGYIDDVDPQRGRNYCSWSTSDAPQKALVATARPPDYGWVPCRCVPICQECHRERAPGHGSDGRASLRISASSVFLPSSRCSSRTWLCKAR